MRRWRDLTSLENPYFISIEDEVCNRKELGNKWETELTK